MNENEQLFSKSMPQKFDVADGGSSFSLGRKAFSKKTYLSYNNNNNNNNSGSADGLKFFTSSTTNRIYLPSIHY